MKSVLISLRPKWCELIASGKKTIEVRKTAPKLETPFKCYIYQTKPKKREDRKVGSGIYMYGIELRGESLKCGKVIGEFVCDKIDEFMCCYVPYIKDNNLGYGHYLDNGVYKCQSDKYDDARSKDDNGIVFERTDAYIDSMLKNSDLMDMQLSAQELFEYIGLGKKGYGWHISDLKIYDKPKELGELYVRCGDKKMKCDGCKYKKQDSWFDPPYCEVDGYIQLTRPPQSWCYVEELDV